MAHKKKAHVKEKKKGAKGEPQHKEMKEMMGKHKAACK